MLVPTLLAPDDELWHGTIPWTEVVGKLIKNPHAWAATQKSRTGKPLKLADCKTHPDVSIVLNYPPHWHKTKTTKAQITLFQHTNIITVHPEDSPKPLKLNSVKDSSMRVTLSQSENMGYWHYEPGKADKMRSILKSWVDNPIDTLAASQPPQNNEQNSAGNIFIAGENGIPDPAPSSYTASLSIDPEKTLQFIFTWNAETNVGTDAECVKSVGTLSNNPTGTVGVDYQIKSNMIWYYSYATPPPEAEA